jgi:hypothetical protein
VYSEGGSQNKINIAKKIQNQEENTTTSGSGKLVHLEEATHVINVENNVIPKCAFITAYILFYRTSPVKTHPAD